VGRALTAAECSRLLVIGLDCADPRMIFGPLRESMPNLDRLAKRGLAGRLESCVPPTTIPAWVSMFTGRDPGQLGVYGFRDRRDNTYQQGTLFSSRMADAPRIWDRLSDAGLVSYLIGVPGTYPPWPIRGRMVSSLMTPDTDSCFTFPADLKDEVERISGGYMLDVEGFRDLERTQLLERIGTMTERRFKLAREWAAEPDWDLFVLVEIGSDRLNHGFLRHLDPGHPLHDPGHPLVVKTRVYLEFLDRQIAALVDAAGKRTAVLVVSDHGAQPMRGGFAINEWLIAQGDLILKETPLEARQLSSDMIDWRRTRAWSAGGYSAKIYINAAGREPQGIIAPEDFEDYRAGLAARLADTRDEEGKPLGTRVFYPERVYRALRGIPPDLIAYLGDLSWRALGKVGVGRVHLTGNDSGADDANHATQGIFIYNGPDGRVSLPAVHTLTDVDAFILSFFGIENQLV